MTKTGRGLFDEAPRSNFGSLLVNGLLRDGRADVKAFVELCGCAQEF